MFAELNHVGRAVVTVSSDECFVFHTISIANKGAVRRGEMLKDYEASSNIFRAVLSMC